RPDSGTRLTSGAVRCQASVGGRRTAAVLHGFRNGLAGCAWRIPAGTAGEWLRVSIRVRNGELWFARSFTTRVQKHS
ncbi:MAG: hypothetical protein M3M94_00630, partial [Actinomycetota bacterium]|nr:hypothetical protein [Actinomycetota bacterium]